MSTNLFYDANPTTEKCYCHLENTCSSNIQNCLILRLVGREKRKTQDENLKKAVELKMNKPKNDKLSVTMKEALARNAVEENKMKATMGAMSFEQQAPVVQKVDNAIRRINRYPADKC